MIPKKYKDIVMKKYDNSNTNVNAMEFLKFIAKNRLSQLHEEIQLFFN